MKIAVVSFTYPGEKVCGDAAAVSEDPRRAVIAVIDGLGHGPEAHKAAEEARTCILEHADEQPGALMQRCHLALRSTRGAVIGLARLEASGRGVFSGVGNIGLVARSESAIHVISHAGIVGQRVRKIVECEFRWAPGDLLCLFSDGLTSKLSLEEVDAADPERAARALLERYGRGNDDATVALAVL